MLLAYIVWVSPTFKEVAAGVAILLIGMVMLETGFKTFAQGALEKLIHKFTNKLYKSISLGFLSTALLQSSSLVSVVVISFISAGLLSLTAGIGVIFGANLGTTATAWLVSLFGLKIKISALSMPMLVFGVLLKLQKKESIKAIGDILTGLGFFFLGIHFMKDGFDTFKDSINLANYTVSGFWGIMIYSGIGILITIILQSSSATLALILTALAVNQITYNSALAMAIGANVGTTVTAVLGSISANVEGKRLAGAHFVFNIITGLIAIIFINQLGYFVNYISPHIGISDTNYTLKLSLFHTIFNLIGVAIMTPFINLMVKILNRVFVEKIVSNIAQPKFLNEAVLEYSNTAIKALRKESKNMFEKKAFKIICHGLNILKKDIYSDTKLKEVVKSSREEIHEDIDELYYRKIKSIYSKIYEFASLSQRKFKLSNHQIRAINRVKLANRFIIHSIKDIKNIHPNLSKFMVSDNKNIRNSYDKLRTKIALVLKEISLIQHDQKPKKHFKELVKLKKKAKKSDLLIDGTIDKLIRKELINSEMATSLANDSEYIARVSENLINATQLLYLDDDKLLSNDHFFEAD